MAIEDRLTALEEEYQLIRGELKQTLSSVRDFLLELNLPAIQEEEQREYHEHNETHNVPGGGADYPAAPSQQMPQTMSSPAPVPYMPGNSPAPSMQPQYSPVGNQMPQNSYIIEEQYDEMPTMTDSPLREMDHPSAGNYVPPAPAPYSEPGPSFDEDMGDFIPEPEAGIEDEIISDADDDSLYEEELTPVDLPGETSDIEDEFLEETAEENELELESDDEIETYQEVEPESAFESEAIDETEEQPLTKKGTKMTSTIDRTSQINLLTNLIRWVTTARKEIGMDYLPVFLDVYGIGDEVSDELREVILYLAATIGPRPVTEFPTFESESEEQPGPIMEPFVEPNGEIWNRMILELHGILRCAHVSFSDNQLPWKRLKEMATSSNKATTDPEMEPPPVEESRVELPDDEPVLDEELITEKHEIEDDDEIDLELQGTSVKNRARSKKAGAKKKAVNQQRQGARLKLVLPIGTDEETEIDIGEFNLSLNRTSGD